MLPKRLALPLPALLILPILALALTLSGWVWGVLRHQQAGADQRHAREELRQGMQVARVMLQPIGQPSPHEPVTLRVPPAALQAGLQQAMHRMPNVAVVVLTQERVDGAWQPSTGEEPAWTKAYEALSLLERQALTAPTPDGSPTEFDANGQVHATLSVASPEAPGGRVVVWLRAEPNVTDPAWARTRWQLLLGVLVGSLLAGGLLWQQGARLREGMRALSGWTHRATQEEWPEVPVPAGPTELRLLGLRMRELTNYRHHREDDIRQTAFRDTLTHLPNRAYFQVRLDQQINEARQGQHSGALVTLDIQRFKHVNAVLGQASGDTLLRKVALRLSATLPDAHHLLGRVGGNQFACLIPRADKVSATQLAKRLLHSMDTPFELDGQAIDLMAQAGVALFPEDGRNANELLSHAEMAMNAARQKVTSVMVYSPDMDPDQAASLSLLTELKQAVNRHQLQLHLQPKICLNTKAVLGAEALIRWRHPEKGLIPPDVFIPFAEQTGFIRVLSLWVVDQAATIWRQWHDAGLPLKIAVNLSAHDLMDRDLPQHLHAILTRHQVPPGAMVLEITEGATMDDPAHAQQILTRLSELGFLLSIDDFGTGYSSLAYLKTLPVHELKIDKSFVLNMQNDLNDAKIVRSVIDLAHNLGMSVVAEGLESAKSWKLLEGLHCNEAQGFFISPPMPAGEFVDWVRAWQAPSVQDEYLNTDFTNIL
ncbi:MAG: bifunctional diguanylate cyclase/phosphodiesterase [Aquabacterium sp.]|jgi:diguanylate cyclase (GGDEF)-like protein|uniref:putative bifunctional diguanylate cyclase/phosphodiesterase n=1 Tax=Aquabacterium sp. TaxID=1872578 RepID=UPI002A372002|nr:bifunctional diguanylate cyclase/phosphodiesterase [Aquabacterium sp.]MDX9843100.1 bifunctional diguanylate cyclase/phosphodiesterase [Aquabacterium sp.]